jgi:SpoVK/Ycf46/Vps4 family AAA+-type ATPase
MREGGSRITLSGLLNAIDGAGAPEGHVLVMTTNTPDALDEALVRPGRIDVKVQFSKAIRSQVKDIFFNMYQPAPAFEDPKPKKKKVKLTEEKEEQTEEEKAEEARLEAKRKEEEEELRKMAEEFSDHVPERQFSPAQLQDYILLRKDQPRRALEEIDAWVAKELMTAAVVAATKAKVASLTTEVEVDEQENVKDKKSTKKKTSGLKSKKQKTDKAEAEEADQNETGATEVKKKDKETKSSAKEDAVKGHSRSSSEDQSPAGSGSESGSNASDDESPATSVDGEEPEAEDGVSAEKKTSTKKPARAGNVDKVQDNEKETSTKTQAVAVKE